MAFLPTPSRARLLSIGCMGPEPSDVLSTNTGRLTMRVFWKVKKLIHDSLYLLVMLMTFDQVLDNLLNAVCIETIYRRESISIVWSVSPSL